MASLLHIHARLMYSTTDITIEHWRFKILILVSQQTRGRKTSIVKRRPLITSNQEIWFANRDTTAAIINSRIVAKRVINATKGNGNLGSVVSQMKKKTKPKNHVDNVPRFSSIPNEFQELCRNKSVVEVTSAKLSRIDFNEFHKR